MMSNYLKTRSSSQQSGQRDPLDPIELRLFSWLSRSGHPVASCEASGKQYRQRRKTLMTQIRSHLAQLVERFCSRIERAHPLHRDAYCSRHPVREGNCPLASLPALARRLTIGRMLRRIASGRSQRSMIHQQRCGSRLPKSLVTSSGLYRMGRSLARHLHLYWHLRSKRYRIG